jgi:cobalt/nickel transport system permease protein
MLLAVHLSDGVLNPAVAVPWLVGGFLLAAVLVALAFPLRDEDIPRTALLTAVFFVASLLHVWIGPTSVHLLMNGLVGIVLGRRAGLAIGLGLLLQAVLLGHGGLTTLGINTVIMTVPALLTASLFVLLHRLAWLRHPWFRSLLVACGVLAWVLTLVFTVAVLCTNPLTALVRPNIGPGFHVHIPDYTAAWSVVTHPLTLGLALLLAGAAAWGERRLNNVPEFPLGFLLGVLAVLLTAALNALVLLAAGIDGWQAIVTVVFLAHLPLAILEGIILGFVVGFLVRVKPDLLGLPVPAHAETPRPVPAAAPILTLKPPVLVLALATLLLLATPLWAHRLEAGYKVLPGQRVLVESWFPDRSVPKNAIVQVFRPDGSVLTEGPLDPEKGSFTFAYPRQETLRIVVNAPAHRKDLKIEASELPLTLSQGQDTSPPVQPMPSDRAGPDAAPHSDPIPPEESTEGGVEHRSSVSYRDVVSGLAFVFALSGFVLSIRQQQHLVELRRQVERLQKKDA